MALGPQLGEALEIQENRDLLESLMADLPARQRELLRLKFHIGLSYKEIAEIPGSVPETSVTSFTTPYPLSARAGGKKTRANPFPSMKKQPDLTSWVLGELSEEEAARLRLLAYHSPELATEVSESKVFCDMMTRALHTGGLTLAPEERERIRAAFATGEKAPAPRRTPLFWRVTPPRASFSESWRISPNRRPRTPGAAWGRSRRTARLPCGNRGHGAHGIAGPAGGESARRRGAQRRRAGSRRSLRA